jgi:ABC-2 type transport system permease protein
MPVFDQGYQHWSGTLSGHTLRWLTITRHGVRVGMKNIFLRLVVIASWFPAVFLAFMLCLWGLLEQKSPTAAKFMWILQGFFPPQVLDDPKHYRVEVWTLCFDWFLWSELWVSMVVVLLVGPALISQDLRFNAMQLYFSRPLRRIDYFVGKLGVIAWFLGLVIILPSLIAYALGLLFSLDLSIIRDTLPLLLASLAYGAVIVLSAGTLILALSSLSRNSRYVALFWVSLWFVSWSVAGIMSLINVAQREQVHNRKYQQAYMAAHPPRNEPADPDDPMAAQRANMAGQMAEREAMRKLKAEIEQEDLEASRADWRPMVSYTGNLSRMGQQVLQTDAAKETIGKLYGPDAQLFFLAPGPQYPWYWSAGVLAVLFGISACILNFRVRSLDRLK